MLLVYLPVEETLFLWQVEQPVRALPMFGEGGSAADVVLLTPEGRTAVSGLKLPLLATATALAALPARDIEQLPATIAVWSLASKLGMELVARERVAPTLLRRSGRIQARWAAALAASEDAARVSALARSMPPAAHAVPVEDGDSSDVWAPDALLRAYLDALVDALVRSVRGKPTLQRPAGAAAWTQRWKEALSASEPSFANDNDDFAERRLVEDVARWSEAALGSRERLRACFRFEPPEGDGQAFTLRFLLQAPDDPSLLVDAGEVWDTSGRSLEKLGRAFRDPQESLLEALARAARLFSPISRALEDARPEALAMDAATAWSFLERGGALLADAGFGVIIPAELTARGQRRLRLRMRVGEKSKVAGVVASAAGLGLDELLSVNWEAAIGEQTLSMGELAALAKQKAPLVRYRGAWVAVDPGELSQIQKRIARGEGQLAAPEAIRLALTGETREGDLAVSVRASGVLAELLDRLRGSANVEGEAPSGLQATLRPYQKRGLHWLDTMGALGLGACLADDMGLGKTLQLLAHLQRLRETAGADERPALLVAPTSVLGNWEREIARFTPSLRVVSHYSASRAQKPEELAKAPFGLVLTSYGLLRRDRELLSAVDWSLLALDEAQNIKNSASASAAAARSLKARERVALTGTPVENRLAELWSIFEFLNPGLLGPLEKFRREFALPIERYGNDEAAARLRKLVGPFILRRAKSDPAVIQDLPPKNEMKVVCTLTREQATLYKAAVDEEIRRIDSSEGMERKGRVLALLTHTKQICNHPAQFLGESGPLANRSGKLARLSEMLDEALAAGDKALVFTQFREMGDRLRRYLEQSLACEVLFLHGGTPKLARDAMVQRFQEEAHGPRVFVLSLKAGGTGLNLTAASHVFHYDRWWNPAVEDQATDRAYRIGQQRAVQVHKLLSAGTVEEKIDRLLEQKRSLASKVVGSGEQWITELDGDALRELFALSETAIADESTESPEPKRARRTRTKGAQP